MLRIEFWGLQDSARESDYVARMATGLRERNRLAAIAHARRTAFELMAERGFDSVTVEEIASATNVSPSTLYRYFGTKEALVLSSSRPAQLVEELDADTSDRTWVEAFQRSAVKVWAGDESARVELSLFVANGALLRAWERQLLDQRREIAAAFARRRAKSGGLKDDVRAAVAVAVLTTTLLRWNLDDGGGEKRLDRLLTKGFAGATTL